MGVCLEQFKTEFVMERFLHVGLSGIEFVLEHFLHGGLSRTVQNRVCHGTFSACGSVWNSAKQGLFWNTFCMWVCLE